jgi:hypothetical protein
MLSLSKHSGQRPLRATLRQAQGDRPTHLEKKHIIGSNQVSAREIGIVKYMQQFAPSTTVKTCEVLKTSQVSPNRFTESYNCLLRNRQILNTPCLVRLGAHFQL